MSAKLAGIEDDREVLLSSYQDIVRRNEDRMDLLISKQEEILDQRLGLNVNSSPGERKAIRPLGRKSWPQVAAKFEADRRQEYWKQRTEDLEKGVMRTTPSENRGLRPEGKTESEPTRPA